MLSFLFKRVILLSNQYMSVMETNVEYIRRSKDEVFMNKIIELFDEIKTMKKWIAEHDISDEESDIFIALRKSKEKVRIQIASLNACWDHKEEG